MLDTFWSLLWHVEKARGYPGIHRQINDLEDEGSLSASRWKSRQEGRLRSLLSFAGSHVPYYKRLFQDAGLDPDAAKLPQDLTRLPLLTKDIIRENLDDLLADTTKPKDRLESATGGSTGVPLTFYQDGACLTAGAAIDAYVLSWWGIRPYDRTALIWGADRDFHQLTLKERFYQFRKRTRSLNAFRMSTENLQDFLLMLQKWKPPYLVGYASALGALADCARKQSQGDLHFKVIRSTAEMLWPEQRSNIEEALGGELYNFYGSREINNIAAECPEERRMHLISTLRWVEIVDDQGKPVDSGAPGHIVVTDLSNRTMPFIRYRNEDIGRMAPDSCPCGRPSPVLDELLGRVSDIIRSPRGDIIHGEFFTHLFYGRDDIRQFQIHQKALDHVIVRYVPCGVLPADHLSEVVDQISRQLGGDVSVETESCESIPLPPSGKHRFTISDVGCGVGSAPLSQAKGSPAG